MVIILHPKLVNYTTQIDKLRTGTYFTSKQLNKKHYKKKKYIYRKKESEKVHLQIGSDEKNIHSIQKIGKLSHFTLFALPFFSRDARVQAKILESPPKAL